jgi:hypothetical protein
MSSSCDRHGGIAPCSVEICEASVAVNNVKRPSQFSDYTLGTAATDLGDVMVLQRRRTKSAVFC